MSTHKTKEELVRLAWQTALLTQGERQCHVTARDGFGGVCVMELLREITGSDPDLSLIKVGRLAGISSTQTIELTARNDGRYGHHQHTFAELHDIIAGWPIRTDFGGDWFQ